MCGLFYTGISLNHQQLFLMKDLISYFVCLFVLFLNVRNSNKREVAKNNPRKHNGIMYFNSSMFVYTNITPSVKFADSPVYFDIRYLNK